MFSYIHLDRMHYECYVGALKSTLSEVTFMTLCGAHCLDDHSCAGVNFWPTTHKCDLVFEDTDRNQQAVKDIAGCEYYKVVS